MYSRYKNTLEGIVILEDNKAKFMKSLKENEEFMVEYVRGAEIRTRLANSYLWGGVYGAFVPNSFDRSDLAHKHFGDTFLSRFEVVSSDNEDRLNEIKNESREKDGFKIEPKVIYKGKEMTVEYHVNWVKSTTKLKRKEFNEYIEQISNIAHEFNVIVLTSKEYHENN